MPERNLPARYNICPTSTIDAVIERDGADALGPCAVLVEKDGQGNALHVQRASRDGGGETDVSLGVQAQPMPDPGLGLL